MNVLEKIRRKIEFYSNFIRIYFVQVKMIPTFAPPKNKERWVSGWNQQFAKLPHGQPCRGFESPSLRSFGESVLLIDIFIKTRSFSEA